ncbi:hypothetical protein COPR103792_09725 [Corynebacterium propinquum]|uniref:hypothetical protein n=2 Tax=Corynebacterium propinquum TaxID=43769 RepID=UPI0012DC6CE4|nr:hypothetical protein [Corynebacterium propinquum]MDK4240057.1 hypothetical protein [Corynebacterium propinquum]MDK4283040.1 hypothetical protein [Corynebacterium propinquum]MDK4319005.1 hypothetical protein [Corynebacterium propinquum]QQU91102.1 hypothetical protein I6I69_02220 [Corynebacterium propinquum]UQV59708.1 hypothetical protein L9H28_07855 [Corynebacterium propinquum]
MLTKEFKTMAQQKSKLKWVENLCWTIIEFVYSSVAAVCVIYSPTFDTAGNQITLIGFRDGASALATISIALVFVLAIILLIVYEVRKIPISIVPFLFIIAGAVVFMMLAPLVGQICDNEIFAPIFVAALGVVIVKTIRTRVGRRA